MSQRKLAVAAGLSETSAHAIEAGGRIPTLDTAERLALALGVPACWLAYGAFGAQPFQGKIPKAEQTGTAPTPAPIAGPVTRDALACLQVGARLLQARTEAGLSLRALARAADMTPSGVSSIETGRTVPSVATVETLAMALGRAPCWLGFGTEG